VLLWLDDELEALVEPPPLELPLVALDVCVVELEVEPVLPGPLPEVVLLAQAPTSTEAMTAATAPARVTMGKGFMFT
jgi:hypothetical protein